MKEAGATMQIAITYSGDTIESQAFVEKRMRRVLDQILKGKDGKRLEQK